MIHAATYSIAHVSFRCQTPVDEDTEITHLYYRGDLGELFSIANPDELFCSVLAFSSSRFELIFP